MKKWWMWSNFLPLISLEDSMKEQRDFVSIATTTAAAAMELSNLFITQLLNISPPPPNHHRTMERVWWALALLDLWMGRLSTRWMILWAFPNCLCVFSALLARARIVHTETAVAIWIIVIICTMLASAVSGQ